MLTTTNHDSVLLRADDPLIDMNYITSFTGMTDKWFYKLISEGHFPKPIKLGRSSRWYKSEVEQWMQQRIEESRGQQHETCCNAGAGIAEISPVPDAGDTPAHLSADSSGQPTVCHHFLTDSSFPSSRQSLVFVLYRAGVDVRFPCVCTGLTKFNRV